MFYVDIKTPSVFPSQKIIRLPSPSNAKYLYLFPVWDLKKSLKKWDESFRNLARYL